MAKGLLPQNVHQYIQYICLVLIAIGMPSTKLALSMGVIFGIANWILEGGFNEKFSKIKSSPILLFLLASYALMILSLLWSSDVKEGLSDLKSRLPYIFLPLIFATGSALTNKQLYNLLYLFLATLLVTSTFNVLHYHNIIGSHPQDDIRGLSNFTSHIRYALLIAIGFTICLVIQWQQKKFNWLLATLAMWLLIYTLYSQVISGYIAIFLSISGFAFFIFYRKSPKTTLLFGLSASIIIFLCAINYLKPSIHQVDCSTLPKLTEKGEKYEHDCSSYSEINGQPILAYYSPEELEKEWKKMSTIDFNATDLKGQPIRTTIARYLTALNLKKDASGLKKLSKTDIQLIEEGYTYPTHKNGFIMPRIYSLKYQLMNPRELNGHSVLQRLEYWKASKRIIQKNWLMGVGIGANQQAFDATYQEMNSELLMENRHRSHNMFFSIMISNGWLGLLIFCCLVALILYFPLRFKDILSFITLLIIVTSFINEDTLETQLGVTMFGFFVGWMLAFNRTNDSFKTLAK